MSTTTLTDLSIVIVNWNTAQLLGQCLASLTENRADGETEVIVVDNASTDGSRELVRDSFQWVHLIANPANVGFAAANNRGILASDGRYVLLLNSDTIVGPGALSGLVDFLERHRDAGVVSPRLVRPDGSAQPFAYGCDPTLRYIAARGLIRCLLRRQLHNWATEHVLKVDWVSGACMMLRRSALAQVGMLDDRIFMYFEDNDLCLRFRQQGWQVYYNPQVSITHLGGQSLARNPAAREAYYHSLDYFYEKHYSAQARLVLRAGLVLNQMMRRH